MNIRLVILGTDGRGTNFLYNALRHECSDIKVVLEQRQSRTELVRKRFSRLKPSTVIGQLFFQILVLPTIEAFSSSRYVEIMQLFDLDPTAIPAENFEWVNSANSDACIEKINNFQPDLVLLSGTRILTSKTLESINCPVINIHAGITPKYRGVHGAYWALIQNDPEHCGVTLHYVDSGIDTGKVIDQQQISITSEDNFSTYPYLQTAGGIKMLKQHLEDIVSGSVTPLQPEGSSKLWYDPTAWGYLFNRWKRNIK